MNALPDNRRGPGIARERGVTLLEMLVALTLLSLVAWSVYAGIRTAGRSWDAAHARARSVEDQRLVSGVLRSHLSRAYPITETTDRGWVVLFDGTSQAVDFVAELPPYLDVGGLNRVAVRIESDGERRQLTFQRRALVLDEDAEASEAEVPPPRVLIDQIEDAELAYFGALKPDEAPEWHEEWRQQRALPALVRLRIETSAGRWPDLVVHPFVDRPRFERPVARTEQAEPDAAEAEPQQPPLRSEP